MIPEVYNMSKYGWVDSNTGKQRYIRLQIWVY